MEQINCDPLTTLSYSWHRYGDSFLVVRAVKVFASVVMATFAGYSVSVIDQKTRRLMKKHPDALFTLYLSNQLSAHSIDISGACRGSSHYVAQKVEKLLKEDRNLTVRLAFIDGGGVEAIPMYFSNDVFPPVNFNCQVFRSESETVAPGKEITCRHFASAYAMKVFGRRKNSFVTIDSAEKIRSVFANTPDNPFKAATRPANIFMNNIRSYFADGYYFRTVTFCAALSTLVKKYWDTPSGTEKNFIFIAREYQQSGHAMAIRLKKHNGCMKIIFYDPNATLRHKTILLSRSGLVSHITASDLTWCPIGDAFFVNVGDRKGSIEGCDVRFFGPGSPQDFQLRIPSEHRQHRVFQEDGNLQGTGLIEAMASMSLNSG